MKVLSYIQVLAVMISAARERFELETLFNDRDLPQEIALGSSFITTLDVCAGQCVGNSSCSMFRFIKATSSCQLFGDVLHSSGSLAGARYYSYRTEWCALNKQYHMLRALNMCVKLHTVKRNYTDAISTCHNTGAQMIILEDEDKAAAVRTVLDKSGFGSTNIYVGADDMANEGEFVWLDGRNVTREMFKSGEPNNAGGEEDCVMMGNGGTLNDIGCHLKTNFLCEMTE